jgi:mRNA degradation ribonuclease J1/J2
MVKEFRGSPLQTSGDLDNQIKSIIQESLDKAVKNMIESIPIKKVPPERLNEVEIAINREARVAVQAIANGVRVGITIESLDNVGLIAKEVPGVTPEQVAEELKQQRVLEDRVQQSFALLGEPSPALLPRENPGGTDNTQEQDSGRSGRSA